MTVISKIANEGRIERSNVTLIPKVSNDGRIGSFIVTLKRLNTNEGNVECQMVLISPNPEHRVDKPIARPR